MNNNYILLKKSWLLLLIVMSACAFGQSPSTDYIPGIGKEWRVPAAVNSITVEIWGAGGGGGGNNGGTTGGGGGGGGYSKKTISVIPGQKLIYSIGSGGTGSAGNGTAGGTTLLSHAESTTVMSAFGGGAGQRNGSAGAGGTATGGDTNTSGINGVNSGKGGNSPNGGAGGSVGINSAGAKGGVPGGGGGGGDSWWFFGYKDYDGGNGADGGIKISYTPTGTYKASITEVSTGSAIWCAGETRNVSVTIKNTGTLPWTDIPGVFNIGVKWNPNGSSWNDYNVRVSAENLAVNATKTYVLTIKASNNLNETVSTTPGYTTPLAAGTNNLTFDVVYENVSWFGGNNNGVGPGNSQFTTLPQTITAVGTVGNNYLSYSNGTSGLLSATATEGGMLNLTAPSNTYFATVNFASYGTPSGTSPNFVINSTCHAATSQSKSEGYLLGNTGLQSIPATNEVFGDPCSGILKRLYLSASYAQALCSGKSIAITGAIPTGGNSSYTYLWESSTTSATSGFEAASGVNNGKDYSSSALTQTTWFRRYVSSGCASGYSSVVVVKVNPLPSVTFTASPSAASCPNMDITYTTQSGMSNYVWTIPGTLNTDYTITSGGTAGNTLTLKWLTSGNKTVAVNYTNADGCFGALPATAITTVSTPFSLTKVSVPPSQCLSTATVTLTATPAGLPVGTYTVTYSRNDPYATGLTANMQVATAGTGIFTATGLTNANNPGITITVTKLATSTCSTVISSNNVSNTFVMRAALSAPNGLSASYVSCTATKLQWNNGAPYVDNYYLDVSTSSTFNTFISGYESKDLGTAFSENVTGLTPGLTYYYRVVGKNACGFSTPSIGSFIGAGNAVPIIGAITQPTCAVPTGSFIITNSASGISYTVSPNTGVVINGNQITAPPGTYTITATGNGCNPSTATSFTINPVSGSLASPMVNVTLPTCSSSGTATISNYTSSLNYTFSPSGPNVGAGGVISNLTAATSYTVTANKGSCTSLASSSFTVAAQLPTPATPAVSTIVASCSAQGTATITNYTSGLTYTFSPSGPTVGTGGVISNLTAATSYTVTTNNGSCTSLASSSFTVAAKLPTPATPAVSTTVASCSAQGTATITNYTSGLTYTFSPTGPSVLATGLITNMTPGTNYTVTTNNGSCTSTASSSFKIESALPMPNLTLSSALGTDAQTVCSNTAVTSIVYSTTGATSVTVTGLPTGVTFVWNNSVLTISGTPLASGAYTVNLTGNCGTINKTGTITVTPANTVALTSSPNTNNQQICAATAISPITYQTTGATGIDRSGVSTGVNGLPAGVTASWSNNTVTISGTPTVTGTFNYTIPLTGGCGDAKATGTIKVGLTSVYSASGWSSEGIPQNNGLSVKFDSDYNTTAGSVYACDCTVNASKTLTIAPNTSLTVVNNFTNKGSVLVQSEGNLVQINNTPSPANSGNIISEREFKIGTARVQYNYLGSPVAFEAGQSFKTVFPGSTNTTVLYHNQTTNTFATSSGANVPGRGSAVKEPPTTTVLTDNKSTAQFKGTPQNGEITLAIANKNTNVTTFGYNLMGNPYPSNIDLQKLYDINGGKIGETQVNSPNISATFYFWDNNGNKIFEQQGSGYLGQSYAIFNVRTGSNGTGTKANSGTKVPTKIVKVGQGFMTRSLVSSYNFNFNNSIRTAEASAVDFLGKGNSSVTDDRYWLQMAAPSGVVSSIAVVYYPGGNNLMGPEDSRTMGGSDAVYSIVEDQQIGINGRSMFLNTDRIPLGTKHFASGNYTLALENKEGTFDTGQNIYLKDLQTGIITNLNAGSYTFAANAGESTGRFEIVYKPETVLVTESSSTEQILIYKDANDMVLKSPTIITQVEVYDSSGKLWKQLNPNQKMTRVDVSALPNAIYILKIKSQTGEVVSRKFIR